MEMLPDFNKPPARIFQEQILLPAREHAGVPHPCTTRSRCGTSDVGYAVDLKGAAVLPCDEERHNFSVRVGISCYADVDFGRYGVHIFSIRDLMI